MGETAGNDEEEPDEEEQEAVGELGGTDESAAAAATVAALVMACAEEEGARRTEGPREKDEAHAKQLPKRRGRKKRGQKGNSVPPNFPAHPKLGKS